MTVNSAIFGTVIGSSVTPLNSQAAVHSDQSSVLICDANTALVNLENNGFHASNSLAYPQTPTLLGGPRTLSIRSPRTRGRATS